MTMFFQRLRRNQKGFTLIELLVVVAIIALLATFAVPKLFNAISESRKAPGKADLQTISGALDRYYLDKNTYPGSAADAKALLTNSGYLKATTSFTNGFSKGYIYITNTAGGFYILVDPRNTSAEMTVTCNSKEQKATASANFQVVATTTITADDITAGCSFNPTTTDASLVTN